MHQQIDYFERAKRQEEIPLLEEQAKEDSSKLREQWVKQEEERVSSCYLPPTHPSDTLSLMN